MGNGVIWVMFMLVLVMMLVVVMVGMIRGVVKKVMAMVVVIWVILVMMVVLVVLMVFPVLVDDPALVMKIICPTTVMVRGNTVAAFPFHSYLEPGQWEPKKRHRTRNAKKKW